MEFDNSMCTWHIATLKGLKSENLHTVVFQWEQYWEGVVEACSIRKVCISRTS